MNAKWRQAFSTCANRDLHNSTCVVGVGSSIHALTSPKIVPFRAAHCGNRKQALEVLFARKAVNPQEDLWQRQDSQ
jgi:hypothetical protein